MMVSGVITSEGGVVPPFIFSHGLRLKIDSCIKWLGEVVLTKVKRVVTLCLATKICTLLDERENTVMDVSQFLRPHHQNNHKGKNYHQLIREIDITRFARNRSQNDSKTTVVTYVHG